MKALLIARRATLVVLMLSAMGVGAAHAVAPPEAAPVHSAREVRRLVEVPEPASMLLLGSGLVGLGIVVRRGLTRRD